jgi:cytoskeletal protein CcmA (bactofilin family)
MNALRRLLGLAVPADPVERPFAPPVQSTTSLGPGVVLKGEMHGEGTVTILGQFEGDIVLTGDLHVGPDARVDANISATRIVVAGLVHGNLSADTRVEILPSGALAGTVRSGSFAAATGASVKGEVWIEQRQAPAPERPERPA